MALLNSGFEIPDPSTITAPLSRVLHHGLGLDHKSAIEEIEVEIDDEEEEENAQDAGEPDEEIEMDAM